MKNAIKSALFFSLMITLATACQSKKTESDQAASDTTTVIESETLISGDSAEVITDTATFVAPDTTKK